MFGSKYTVLQLIGLCYKEWPYVMFVFTTWFVLSLMMFVLGLAGVVPMAAALAPGTIPFVVVLVGFVVLGLYLLFCKI